MSDWLDEIEDEATLALEGNEAFTGGYMDDLRMARVIRELARMGHLLLHTMNEFGQQKYLDILSPDAKELLK